MSQGVEVNLDSFGRAASHLRRLYETLGIKRQPREVETTLTEYLAQFQEPRRTRAIPMVRSRSDISD